MIHVSVRAKYGPRIERERREQTYHCLAYPCPRTTRLFYRPANSHLCVQCIREKYLPRCPATAPVDDGASCASTNGTPGIAKKPFAAKAGGGEYP